MWNQVANNSILWKTVRMKNSQVNDWRGFMKALKRHGTQHLDLRKVLIPATANWTDFQKYIGDVSELESIDLCKCPANVITGLFDTNPNLCCLNALSITDEILDLSNTIKASQLTELRLKSVTSITINNLSTLQQLTNLKHLALTSVKNLNKSNYGVIGGLKLLESLELGDCNDFHPTFPKTVLSELKRLERLRLEKGTDNCCIFEILETISELPNLVQLELVNFDIKSGFDTRLAQCKNLKRLLLIPTYISQSATTNNMILSGISKLTNTLQTFTWVVTQELLRVTDLYVDQCETKKRDRRPLEDKIPILKPVPLMTKDAAMMKSVPDSSVSEAPQVEILPLHIVQSIVTTAIPNMKLKILKVPFLATWRQTLAETQ